MYGQKIMPIHENGTIRFFPQINKKRNNLTITLVLLLR